MIPLRDTIQSRNYPVVNSTIIGLNVLLFIVEVSQGPGMDQFIRTYGLLPARYSVPQIALYTSSAQKAFSLLSFMFIHGGFWHLLGNMWSLYIFGDNVEDRLGPLRYLLFYLLCGLASGLVHLVTNWNSVVPTVGASGAIAGVMGAYLILYPNSKILTFIPIFFFPYFIEIRALFFLGIWFVIQLLSAAGSHGQVGGIAWWAHIGGFVSGIFFLKLFLNIPEFGLTNRIQQATSKKKTHRLQVIRPAGSGDDPHLYGDIHITPREAEVGTRKLVNIPWGPQKRLLRITVPHGVSNGSILRLAGMGRGLKGGRRGDLYLKVRIRPRGDEAPP